LFDLDRDISETTDLSSQHPEVVDQLSTRIDHFLASTQAVLPVPNENYKAQN
jgi:hypothetical protein